jgi:nicotinamide phosphoribosyltransferase
LKAPITKADIDEAEQFFFAHLAGSRPDIFNRAGFERIVEKYGGKLPLLIRCIFTKF